MMVSEPPIICVHAGGTYIAFCNLGLYEIPEEQDILISKEKQLFFRETWYKIPSKKSKK